MGQVSDIDAKAIRKKIGETTIPEEMKVLYLLADAVSIMDAVVFRRIKEVFSAHGYRARENGLLKGITDYCKAQRRAAWMFMERIEPQIIGATFERGGDGTQDPKAYDRFNADANELCRLILLYVDRCANSSEGYSKIFKTLRQLPSGGLFKDEDFTRYKMK